MPILSDFIEESLGKLKLNYAEIDSVISCIDKHVLVLYRCYFIYVQEEPFIQMTWQNALIRVTLTCLGFNFTIVFPFGAFLTENIHERLSLSLFFSSHSPSHFLRAIRAHRRSATNNPPDRCNRTPDLGDDVSH